MEYAGEVNVTSPELVAISPGVQVVADADEPLFYTQGAYWLYRDGYWFTSSNYYRGFARVDFAVVPQQLRTLERPETYARYERNRGSTRQARTPQMQRRSQRPVQPHGSTPQQQQPSPQTPSPQPAPPAPEQQLPPSSPGTPADPYAPPPSGTMPAQPTSPPGATPPVETPSDLPDQATPPPEANTDYRTNSIDNPKRTERDTTDTPSSQTERDTTDTPSSQTPVDE